MYLIYLDEMYTTIQDPNNSVYTSGSETYAQIQPPESVHLSIVVEPNTSQHSDQPDVTPADVADKLYEPAPQPPSVDTLKYVTQKTHSRQGKIILQKYLYEPRFKVSLDCRHVV